MTGVEESILEGPFKFTVLAILVFTFVLTTLLLAGPIWRLLQRLRMNLYGRHDQTHYDITIKSNTSSPGGASE